MLREVQQVRGRVDMRGCGCAVTGAMRVIRGRAPTPTAALGADCTASSIAPVHFQGKNNASR